MNAVRHLVVLAVQVATVIALIVAGGLLAGCGGGDEPEDDRATVGPVDCRARPELCA